MDRLTVHLSPSFVSQFSFVFVLHVQFCKAKSRCTLSQVVHQQHSVTVSYHSLLQYSPPRLLSSPPLRFPWLFSSSLDPLSLVSSCCILISFLCFLLFLPSVLCSTLLVCSPQISSLFQFSFLSSSLLTVVSSPFLFPIISMSPLPTSFLGSFLSLASPCLSPSILSSLLSTFPLDLHETKCLHCLEGEMFLGF